MQLQVNGELHTVADQLTVAMLLEELQFTGRRIAVEVNEAIVPRSQHDQHQLQGNDRVEIVHAIGGG
ncbi:MAG: sulfur carrier protein ThiS [Halomonadaceae bacterium]|nr:MAG: sulfur carrier protein ThiS [Halomonadaceae bacterium]